MKDQQHSRGPEHDQARSLNYETLKHPESLADVPHNAQQSPNQVAPVQRAQEKPQADLQRKEDDEVDSVQAKLEGGGQSLGGETKGNMEKALGADLSGVKVHTGSKGNEVAQSQNARAVTVGQDVAFASGEYQPGTMEGDALLAHELAHTEQQKDAAAVQKKEKGASNESAHEKEADDVAVGATGKIWGKTESWASGLGGKTKAGMKTGLRLQACGGGGTKPKKDSVTDSLKALTDSLKTTKTNPKQDPERQELEKVKSLKIVNYETDVVPGAWNTVKNRMKQRDKICAEATVYLKKGNADQKKALDGLTGRWEDLRTQCNNSKFSPLTGALPQNVDSLNTQDDNDINLLVKASASFSGTRDVLKEFKTAVKDYVLKRKVLDEERIEFARFDDFFLADNVKKITAAISKKYGMTFSPAEIKAQLAKESGDFTNTAIAGTEDKKKGITSNLDNPDFVGIAQMGVAARNGGIEWAKANAGVTIPEKAIAPNGKERDTREIPEYAIQLSIAYMGYVAEGIIPKLLKAGVIMTPVERKKIVLASYNSKTVEKSAQNIAPAQYKNKELKWSDFISNNWIPPVEKGHTKSQPVEYVDLINERYPLTNK